MKSQKQLIEEIEKLENKITMLADDCTYQTIDDNCTDFFYEGNEQDQMEALKELKEDLEYELLERFSQRDY